MPSNFTARSDYIYSFYSNQLSGLIWSAKNKVCKICALETTRCPYGNTRVELFLTRCIPLRTTTPAALLVSKLVAIVSARLRRSGLDDTEYSQFCKNNEYTLVPCSGRRLDYHSCWQRPCPWRWWRWRITRRAIMRHIMLPFAKYYHLNYYYIFCLK